MSPLFPWRSRPAADNRLATVQHLSDVHTGISRYQGARMEQVATDLARVPDLDGIVDTGDSINGGDEDHTARQDRRYLAWREQCARGRPWAQALGNHDIWGNNRSAGQWASTFALPDVNYVVPMGSVAVVCIGPDRLHGVDQSPGGRPAVLLTDATVRWLDGILTRTGPAVVACHTPLPGMTDRGPKGWVHTEAGGPTAKDLVQVLEAHADTVAAYLCGHTHCGPRSPEMAGVARVGGVTLPHLNAGWLGCLTNSDTQGPNRPLCSLTVDVRDDLSVRVRWRDHSRGRWYGPQGPRSLELRRGHS
jgi:hypothetical protein